MNWLSLILYGLAGAVLSAAGSYVYSTGTIDLGYRATTSFRALRGILSLNQNDINAFIESYEIFNKDVITPQDEVKIRDYYRVVNQLCALGEVEKMYIPPVIDLPQGVYGNQLLFEKEMAKVMSVGAGANLLELGCGRGRISHHMARLTGAKVTGMNIDDGIQLKNAIEYANQTGLLGKQLQFVYGSYNDPLPFDNQSFDGFYHVQALTYVSDLDALFAELFRVLKPGARLSFLDWFMLDAFDETNPRHRELLMKTKAIIGTVYTPRPSDYHKALKKAGFELVFSKEASVTGHQYPLIREARDFFIPVGYVVNVLCGFGILHENTAKLLNRLNLYVDDFVESDSLGLFTTSYWVVARKPTIDRNSELSHMSQGVN